MRSLALVLVAAVFLVAPAAARAATVTTVDGCAGDVVCSKYALGGPVPVSATREERQRSCERRAPLTRANRRYTWTR